MDSQRPKSLMRRHLTTIAVILAAATGCDNVEWGDAYIEVVGPPTSEPVEEVAGLRASPVPGG